ncbi:MAG: cytochrome c nitrite reductase small subunit [Nitrospirae bacterium]|nr:cytochrome c nitrite reductase small subunit [Nitrospirota bacterium]
MNKDGKIALVLVIVAGAIITISVFLLFGPPKLMAKTAEPDFCVGCHVMEAEYEAWIHTGAHRREKCVECHLPDENTTAHYLWKSIDGLKDVVVFYSGRVPERVSLTQHGEKVLHANCVRCHESTVMLIDHERQCWKCHRRIAHKHSGLIETF